MITARTIAATCVLAASIFNLYSSEKSDVALAASYEYDQVGEESSERTLHAVYEWGYSYTAKKEACMVYSTKQVVSKATNAF